MTMSYQDEFLAALKGFLRDESGSDLPSENLESRLEQLQRRETLGHVAAGVAQDFIRFLTIIMGYEELALHALPVGHPLRDYLVEIGNSANQAVRLTRQLVNLSRGDTPETVAPDITPLVEDVYRLLCHSLSENIEFVCVHASGLDGVEVSPSELKHVLINLFLNARDAMPKGGRITLVTETVFLKENLAHGHGIVGAGSYVRLAISDTGHGMEEATLARVFQPFFTTNEPARGAGLRLAIIQQIVRRNGGEIVVASELGRGSTFAVYLPRMRGERKT
jgi:two-component system cell cycle sensor histidine kinase/response regulator CckA